MKKKMDSRGEKPVSFSWLMSHLEKSQISFQTLNFAQARLTDDLQKGFNDQTFNPVIEIYKGDAKKAYEENIYDADRFVHFDLQGHIISDVLAPMVEDFGDKTDIIIMNLALENYHFIRTKFINNIYEIIEKYILQYAFLTGETENVSKKKFCSLRLHFRSLDWYIMLYLLRNNASHADGVGKIIEFKGFVKDLGQNPIVWRTISVEEGKFGHEIRYNSTELLLLFDELFTYLKDNIPVLIKSKDGTVVNELAK